MVQAAQEGPVVLAERTCLRAYVRSAWGLGAKAMAYADLASWLAASIFRRDRRHRVGLPSSG